MDGSGNGHPVPARLHELEDGHLPRDVLVAYPVGTQHQVAFPRLQLLALGVVQVGEEDLLGQGHGPPQAAADDGQPALHAGVGAGDEFRCGVCRVHGLALLLRWPRSAHQTASGMVPPATSRVNVAGHDAPMDVDMLPLSQYAGLVGRSGLPFGAKGGTGATKRGPECGPRGWVVSEARWSCYGG